MLTQSQIQVPVDTNILLDTTTDCLHFVTEFFEAISQSAPHIYHSALQLVPQSSIVRKLYSPQAYFPATKVVTGIPASWDLCTASTGAKHRVQYATWSPCGQFIVASFGSTIQVQDSTTLERVSVLKSPTALSDYDPNYLTFSPDGHLLACYYDR